MERRDFLRAGIAASAGAAALAGTADADGTAAAQRPKGRIRQSVCAWCYGGMKLEDLCAMAKRCGIGAVDLLDEPQWATVTAAGLQCAVANGPGGITKGWNRTEHHDQLVKRSEELLPKVGAAGIPQMIVFSGNRDGMADAEGLRNCAAGLRRIMPLAERSGVTVIMELLNSKVDHRDYMCDRTAWGVELCKQVGSDRFRLLYDIYHMQVMEGDVIRTIRDHHAWIAHYHTAGNPGRSNLDDTQELNYRGICAAIADTGFKGWVAQEFMPRGDAEQALAAAVRACDA
ncbi:MAG: hydroxypyruvate isomerase family protein [Planctomycetota bacterium]